MFFQIIVILLLIFFYTNFFSDMEPETFSAFNEEPYRKLENDNIKVNEMQVH